MSLITNNLDNYYMNYAFELSKKAYSLNEVPVGAIIVLNGEIIAEGYNQKESNNSVISHAEIIAIENASKYLNNWRLNQCQMYVTLEPCPMCAGAIIQSRISKIVYGTNNPNYGSFNSIIDLHKYYPDSKNLQIQSGIMDKEISELLKSFFRKKI